MSDGLWWRTEMRRIEAERYSAVGAAGMRLDAELRRPVDADVPTDEPESPVAVRSVEPHSWLTAAHLVGPDRPGPRGGSAYEPETWLR